MPRNAGMPISKRNIAWLIAIAVVAAIVWLAVGWVWGLVAGGAVLVVSEFVERAERRRRRTA